MKQTEQVFEELYIPRKQLHDAVTLRYRVYNDARNYKLVEAGSALEALTRSGITKAYKIERHNPLGENVIQIAQVSNMFAQAAAPLPYAVEEAASAPTTLATETLAPATVEEEADEHETVEISVPKEAVINNEGINNALNG